MKRRQLLQFGLASAGAMAAPLAMAQAPAQAIQRGRPIRIVLAAPPGGPLDTLARALAQNMSKTLETAVIVDNRPGASGIVGTQHVARSVPDGHTVQLTIDAPLTQIPHTMPTPYDVFNDITPIGQVSNGGLVLVVNANLPVKNLSELQAYVKQNGQSMNYASFGNGSVSHIYGELLTRAMGSPVVHVPFQGSAHAIVEVLTGRSAFMFDSPASATPHAAKGTVRVLGATGPARRKFLPDVPTMLEQGYKGFEQRTWIGLIGPAKLPASIVDQFEKALIEARQTPEISQLMQTMYFETSTASRTEFASILRSDYEAWGRNIKELNIRI